MTMERVREVIAINAKLADELTWLWLTLEQMGFPLRPTGGGEHEDSESRGFRQQARGTRPLSCVSLVACDH